MNTCNAKTGRGIHELKEMLASLKPEETHKYPLIADLIAPEDLVLLVVPIDKAAPKGRLILPQQQTIRAVLEKGALSLVVRDTELKSTLESFRNHGITPKLVITDSQVFSKVSATSPAFCAPPKAVPPRLTKTRSPSCFTSRSALWVRSFRGTSRT